MTTAQEAFRRARPGPAVIGWKLDRAEREQLLARWPPTHARPIADHVTLRAHVRTEAILPSATTGLVVGRSDDGSGVEALVVQVEGRTQRPDGGTYHVTWSLGPGRKAVESNAVIGRHGWQPIEPPVPVRLVPARF